MCCVYLLSLSYFFKICWCWWSLSDAWLQIRGRAGWVSSWAYYLAWLHAAEAPQQTFRSSYWWSLGLVLSPSLPSLPCYFLSVDEDKPVSLVRNTSHTRGHCTNLWHYVWMYPDAYLWVLEEGLLICFSSLCFLQHIHIWPGHPSSHVYYCETVPVWLSLGWLG